MKKTLLGTKEGWRYWRSSDLDDTTMDELKCTQNIRILPGPKKLCWYRPSADVAEADIGEFYCIKIYTQICLGGIKA